MRDIFGFPVYQIRIFSMITKQRFCVIFAYRDLVPNAFDFCTFCHSKQTEFTFCFNIDLVSAQSVVNFWIFLV